MFVNIPRTIDDPYYRYRMPVMQIKTEGKGNGIKTVIINLQEIALSLERDPEYIIKFFSFQLGAGSHKKNTINGNHQRQVLDAALDVFIEKYVLCCECGNPETIFKRDKLGCKACGFVQKLPLDKLISYKLNQEKKSKRSKDQ